MAETVVIPTSMDFARPRPGGTESYIRGLASHLARRGVRVLVFGPRGPGDLGNEGNLVRHVAVGGATRSEARFALRLMMRKRRLMRAVPPGSVVLGNAEHYCLPFVTSRKKLPVVLVAHGAVRPTLTSRKGGLYAALYERLVERPVARKVDAVIAVNTEALEYYRRKYPSLREKTTHVPVAVDTSSFRPMDRKEARKRQGLELEGRIVLYVGRLAPEKRVDLLLRAFARVQETLKDTALVILGDGPERERLESLAAALKIQNWRLLGTKPRDEIPEVMNCADVLVLTSEREAMPTVVLEAMACGVPVVSTRVGDVAELIADGRTGYLADADVGGISEGIKSALLMGDSGRAECVETARRYSWDLIVGRIMEVCREASQED